MNKDSGKLLLKYPWILSPSIQENYSHIISFFYSESVSTLLQERIHHVHQIIGGFVFVKLSLSLLFHDWFFY